MNLTARYDAQTRSTKKMPDITAILVAIFQFLIQTWTKFSGQPQLRLAYRLHLDLQAFAHSGNIQLEIKNLGRKPATGVVLEFAMQKPKWIDEEIGLFFNTEIGSAESVRAPLTGDMAIPIKSKRHRFRLKPEVFINRSDEPLWVAYFPVVAFESDVPEDLNYELDWQISYSDGRTENGEIKVSGADLKRMLLQNIRSKIGPPS